MTQKIDLHSTIDASVWAAEFCKLNTAADEGAMLGWFANAIMTGFDEANRRASMRGAFGVFPAESVNADTQLQTLLNSAYSNAIDAHVCGNAHGTIRNLAEAEGKIFAYIDVKIATAHAEGRRSAIEELHPQWLKEKERADRAERLWLAAESELAHQFPVKWQAQDLSPYSETIDLYARLNEEKMLGDRAKGCEQPPSYYIRNGICYVLKEILLSTARFARRVDAERFCEGDSENVRIAEHMWHVEPQPSDNLQQASTAQAEPTCCNHNCNQGRSCPYRGK